MTRDHGTHVKYVIDRCRCDACRMATRTYERARRRRRVPAYVGASRAREHIEWLSGQGIGLKTVAKVSGVSHGALSKLVYGDTRRGTVPSQRIRRETEQKILGVTPAGIVNCSLVDATRTWRIIDEILARGWSKAAIGRRVHGPQARSLQLGTEKVQRRHAATIAGLLDEVPPPIRHRNGKAMRSRWQPKPAEAR